MLEYIHRDSLIHKLHPLTKLFWALVVMSLSLIFNSPWFLAVIILTVLAVGFIGKVGKQTLVYLSALLLIAGIVFLFQVLFRPEGKLLLQFSLPPGLWLADGSQ
jgi:energy-coupling factor transport system permease protein